MIEDGKLFRLKGAPVILRPAYVVYRSDPVDAQSQEIALSGLRKFATY